MQEEVRVHSRGNRLIAVVVWVLAVAVGVASALDGTIAALPLLAYASLAAWIALWRPAVAVGDAGVTVQNVLQTVVVPWAALVDVSTQYALTLRTPHGVVRAFAAPQPGRYAALRARRAAQRGGASVEGVRPGDLEGTESGDAAALVRDRWATLVEAGRVEAGVATDTRLERRWHVGTIVALGLGAVAVLVLSPLLA